MALSIKDAETDQLARELAKLTGETITQATKRALAERPTRTVCRADPGGNGSVFSYRTHRYCFPIAPSAPSRRRARMRSGGDYGGGERQPKKKAGVCAGLGDWVE
jgi:hypothetical protein